MAVYRVQDDGKAQSGLKAGDQVVTGGGTYKITGVNADGSYQSTKVSDTTTSTYKGSYANSGSGGGTNSQYTGSSTGVKVNNSLQQTYKDQMNANSIAWHNADEAEKRRLEAENQALAQKLGGTVAFDSVTGTWSGEAGGITQDDILNWSYNESKPTYDGKYDAEMERLLNEILNRDKFTYDAQADPMYQMYADMYHREGDRAMKETMAEAAAGAGGMNTYAITAAQQAANNYSAQLNDRIPELYQLAYQMYLQDIEGKVRDLGLLENMDATQYNRYRDTMTDWKDDKNFAYGLYQDAVQQGNWETNFDNNNYWSNKNFEYNDFWNNKNFDYNDEWKVKDWNSQQEDKEYEKTQAEKESARAEIEWYIKNGVTTINPELIKKAGLDETAINQIISYYQTQQTETGTSSSGGGTQTSGGTQTGGGGYDNGGLTTEQVKQLQSELGVSADGLWGSESSSAAGGLSADEAWEKYGDDSGANPVGDGKWDATDNYATIDDACKELLMTDGKDAVLDYLREALAIGAISIVSYNTLVYKYTA